MKKQHVYRLALLGLLVSKVSSTSAQVRGIAEGATAITTTKTALVAYIDPVTQLVYVICGIVAVVGGYRVFQKLQSGDQDAQKSMIGWGGAFAFLLVVNFFIRTVLGL